MDILRRKARAAKAAAARKQGEALPARQRIEVTVEREWVSMLVRRSPASSPLQETCDQADLPQLPTPPPIADDRN